MVDTQVEASVRRTDGVAIIDLSGDIDGFAEGPMNEAFNQADQANPRAIVLNFDSVDYINSTGIALIVSVLAHARKRGRDILAFGLSEHYKKIFEITRLADFMRIVPDEEAAIASK